MPGGHNKYPRKKYTITRKTDLERFASERAQKSQIKIIFAHLKLQYYYLHLCTHTHRPQLARRSFSIINIKCV